MRIFFAVSNGYLKVGTEERKWAGNASTCWSLFVCSLSVKSTKKIFVSVVQEIVHFFLKDYFNVLFLGDNISVVAYEFVLTAILILIELNNTV